MCQSRWVVDAATSPDLMMDIMIRRSIGGYDLEWIPGKTVPTVVVDGFHSGKSEEEHGLTGGHSACCFGKNCADGVEDKALDRVVVERTKRVWDIQPMVPAVEVFVKKVVGVHCAMQKIFPGVNKHPSLR